MQADLKVVKIRGSKVSIEISVSGRLIAERDLEKTSNVPGAQRRLSNAREGQTFIGQIDESHDILEVGDPA